MAANAKFIKDESTFLIESGEFNENNPNLNPGVTAKLNNTTGDFEALNINETPDALDAIGWHVNSDGRRWWSDPCKSSFWYRKYMDGSGNWAIYKQTNIYTTARKYAGKDSLYGMHIFRYPNISSSSTWGGLRLYPPAEAKIRGHKYRFSFDYRGYTGGHHMDVYQSTEIGWSNLGMGLPSAWGRSLGAFDTDWEWRRYEQDFEIEDSKLDFVPGSNQQAWNSTTSFPSGYYGITYNGYVYRKYPGVATTVGLTPEEEYQNGGVYNAKVPMTAGYFDIYRQIKIGFTYQNQNNRGTHVYVDNIQMTDITTNQRWKYNGTSWEADNLAEETIAIKAVGTAYVSLDKGDSGDIFACEGSRLVEVNGTNINTTSGRGLSLDILDANGGVVSQSKFDTYGDDNARTSLANTLAGIPEDQYWILTSFDAISYKFNIRCSNEIYGFSSSC